MWWWRAVRLIRFFVGKILWPHLPLEKIIRPYLVCDDNGYKNYHHNQHDFQFEPLLLHASLKLALGKIYLLSAPTAGMLFVEFV